MLTRKSAMRWYALFCSRLAGRPSRLIQSPASCAHLRDQALVCWGRLASVLRRLGWLRSIVCGRCDCSGNERRQVGLHGLDVEARQHRIVVGIGFHLGAIEIQFLTPDQASLLALLDDVLEETPEGVHAIAVADAGQAGMIGQRLV